jgi:HD-GYP domain-containing protein (c-di-GMP phosphodiesterase class II)
MSTALPIDAGTERLIGERLESRTQALPPRQRAVECALAVLTLAAAVAVAVLAEPDRAFSAPLAVAFVAAYVFVNRVVFTLGEGTVAPTVLLFVPMLLLLPTPYVPLLITVAVMVGAAEAVRRGEAPPQRLPLACTDAAYSLAPALVLILLDAQTPEWASWPLYAFALAAGFVADSLSAVVRDWAVRLPARVALAESLLASRVDVMLAPIGLLAAIGAADAPAAALLVLPLVALLRSFASEREARIEQTLELGRSYRGTALLLCDLLEDDDEYTGHHTHDVVELSARVAAKLGVSEDVKRETELGAMLHDIGKIHIPDAIINKSGPLDDEEWKLMKTHTLEGQRMLDRVGGLLGSVGLVVRASHERFDGGGYPDGLAGDEIPLAARIVAVCDAFNAMTTTRSYRKAMPLAVAVEELHRCSGTQFDPGVVTALLDVIGDPGWQLAMSQPVVTVPRPGRLYSSAP